MTHANINKVTKVKMLIVRNAIAVMFLGIVLACSSLPSVAKDDPHLAILGEDSFPSASQCASCHEQIYEEWRGSSHAYASISPMFHLFEQAITDLAPTIGNFCVRCHAAVGTQLGEPRELPLWERSQVSREGVTCVTCHRVSEAYLKVNGERRIEPGGITAPVYGNLGGPALSEVIEQRGRYRIAIDDSERGAKIHSAAIAFEPIKSSEFCVSCHQVAVNLGIKLEVVWDQYRASPAFDAGVRCHDCHMSKEPGVAAGFEKGPAAVVNGIPVNPDRDHHNHAMIGPGYPIAHPGVFPHNVEADWWSVDEWLQFNYRAGWGNEDFEDRVDSGEIEVDFPDVWADASDREEARLVIN